MSPPSPTDPPGLAQALLRLSVRDPNVREGLLGDLQEEYTRRQRRGGPSKAPRWAWYLLAVTALAGRFLLASVRGAVGMGSRPATGSNSRVPEPIPDALANDIRYAVRTLRKSPGFTAIVVISLALGIGATSTIFSALNPILLRPLPFVDSDRLVFIDATEDERRGLGGVRPTLSTYLDWKQRSPAFEQLEFISPRSLQETRPGIEGAEQMSYEGVGPGLFDLLGVEPLLGRNFVEDDVPPRGQNAQAGRSVILSYGLWQRQFGGDPDILGQAWGNRVVIGVMPPGFRTYPFVEPDYWLVRQVGHVIGRLNPGVSIEDARTQLEAITGRLENPWVNVAGPSDYQVRVSPLRERWSGRYARNLYLLLGAASLVLLIACSNVASLLVGRATHRHREITTRSALGAGRLRLMRQLLTESVVLALFGGVLGVLMAIMGTRLFVILDPTWYLPVEKIRVDGMVLGFTLGLSLLTAILFGMAPALRASNPDLARSLKSGGRGSSGGSRPLFQKLLVGSQVAVTLVLIIGAALMVNSFVRLGAVDRGYSDGLRPEQLLTAQINLVSDRYLTRARDGNQNVTVVSPEADQFYREVIERIRGLPGVESADMGAASDVTGEGFLGTWNPFTLPGRPASPPDFVYLSGRTTRFAYYHEVTSGYFRTVGIPLLKGRFFTDREADTSSDVVIINEALARWYFPDEDPIGQYLQSWFAWRPIAETPPAEIDNPREIVGVVANANPENPRWGSGEDWNGGRGYQDATVYVPDSPEHRTEFSRGDGARIYLNKRLMIRTTGEPLALIADLRRIVAEADPGVAVFDIQTMEAVLDQTVTAERFWMRALGIFATLALVLAVVGIYGVVSYAVAQRTHEIGVRMALGAHRTDVLEMVIRQGIAIAVGGVIVGVLGAVAATRLISSWLYGVEATDPATFVTVSLVLVGIALLATYVPARTATRVDPLIALRNQ